MTEELSRHSVSVAAVITDDQGRALLIQRRDNQHWEAPGGVLGLAESIHDGLRREVREETGLDVEPAALTGVYKNMNLGVVNLVFRCTLLGGELTENDEVIAFRWASEADTREMVVEAHAARVLDALHVAGPPAVRQHDGTRLL